MQIGTALEYPARLSEWPAFAQLEQVFSGGARAIQLDGLWGAARSLVLSALLEHERSPVLLLTSSLSALHRLAQDLRFFREVAGSDRGQRVSAFIPGPFGPLRGRHQDDASAEQSWLLSQLLSGEALWVVTTPRGLMMPLYTPAEFIERTSYLSVGDDLGRDALTERLHAAGYERVEMVVEVGQWAVRGGIVDCFSPSREGPVRIEFFGDEVESIRAFDPTSQRSVESLNGYEILPLVKEAEGSLLEYLPSSSAVVLEDPSLLDAPPDDAPAALPLVALLGDRPRIELGLLSATPESASSRRFALETRSVGSFRGQFRQLEAELVHWFAEGFRVRLVCQDDLQAERLRKILEQHELSAEVGRSLLGPERCLILIGECSGGFQIPELGLTLLTEEELFGARRRTLRRPRFQRGAALTAFTDLAVGDLVVHEEHGIGRYLGLVTLSADGRDGDYLLLEYAESNRLYLPVSRLGAVSKYLASDGDSARLDRLGGTNWQRVKESVRASLRKMTEELLHLYAQRSVIDGYAFSPDAPWQREFEATFRFEETPDQLRAIEDVKAAMADPRPMDRLVAGDVGYGKTEVALRAAFKCVMDGKQVALLVPTTILAQQHWGTFTERFAPFPFRVEMLSRFRTPKEQKAVVAGLRQGTVDVVIGTHRLLSKDIAFKDLGLVIIDEEHRFGVTHKEKLKRLRKSVDVLTLTATPIPRTLYMSLAGVRDLSAIETPPPDRLPVETIVCRFTPTVIKEAVESELGRGGQVFFVHNRVQSLASMAAFLQRLVPHARIVMAHGQMRERELERVMLRFVSGEADVLVSTSIIESGLDIPASNTLIVNRADRFGLAQLHQLRGRVGRERLQAYAYFLVPADGRIDELAQKRLRVLQELTDLGSGYKLALRDLEIRGAGNLLGAEQHGHIAAVGIDLYTKLLAETVGELKGEPVEETLDPNIVVPVEAYLPEEYVPEVTQRLSLYKRLSTAGEQDELNALRDELQDRFGPLPPPTGHLLEVVELKMLARALGIEKLEAADSKLLLTFAASTPVTPDRLVKLLTDAKGRIKLKSASTLEAVIPGRDWTTMNHAIQGLLRQLA
jgi:transcription-repair coupling factor (superfamily II helicase)